MSVFYLLKEDGGKITLEDLSGSIILESSTVGGPTVDWQAGGAGHPVKRKRRNETEELFDEIQHSLEVALGIAEEPLDVTATAVVEEAAPAWSDEKLREAVERLRGLSERSEQYFQRMARIQAMFRAYEEAQAREQALQDEEETWFLMS